MREPRLPVGGGAAGTCRSAPPNHHVLILIHAGTDARHFTLPSLARGIAWRLFLNTAADETADIYPSLDGPSAPVNDVVTMESRSTVVYVARDVRD